MDDEQKKRIAETNARRARALANDLLADDKQGEFEKMEAAKHELTALLVECLGKDLGRAITLLKDAGPFFKLDRELKEARKQATAQKKSGASKGAA
jgi:hypothetical protein